ncbi:MAG: VTT domain-containing protein [Silvibacterium sp.]|nr:VTT domain-containing protein [Silvibacterium sp.]MBV8436465.1 VTT domain-containing protein [Silvibacterium sp.]
MGVQVCVIFAPSHAAYKHLTWLLHLGALGVFGVSLLDASIILLPVPGSTDLLILLLVANQGNPWLLAGAAISGSMLGAYLTWGAGKKGGETMLQRHVPKRYLKSITRWMKRNGVLTVSIAAVLPPPIPLLPFLLSAGALGLSLRSFLVSFFIARGARYALEAWLSAVYGRQVIRAWAQYLSGWSDVIIWSLLGLVVAAAIFGFWKYRRDKRRFASSKRAHAA